jgi:hypothetical protein
MTRFPILVNMSPASEYRWWIIGFSLCRRVRNVLVFSDKTTKNLHRIFVFISSSRQSCAAIALYLQN